MAELIAFVPGTHEADLRELWTAYLKEAAEDLKREFGFAEDISAVVDDTLQHLVQFAPPAGRLVLVEESGVVLGCGCFPAITSEVAEIKRMYLRPQARGRGRPPPARRAAGCARSPGTAGPPRYRWADAGGCRTPPRRELPSLRPVPGERNPSRVSRALAVHAARSCRSG